MTDMTIDGVATLTAPMHCASFERPPKGNTTVPAMRMRLMHMMASRRPAPAGREAESDDQELSLSDLESAPAEVADESPRRPVSVPIAPGNTTRGHLRQHCSDALLEALALAGEKVSQRAYYSIRKGRASVSGETEVIDMNVIAAAHDDLLTGVFGLETRVPSKLVTPDWVPMIEASAGMIPSRYHDRILHGVAPWQLTYTQTMRSIDPLMAGRDQLAEQVWEGGAEACREWIMQQADALAAQREDRASGEDVSRQDFRNIFGVEAVAPLTPFYTRIALRDVASEAHHGFLLLGLQRMLEAQNMGGLKRLGMGRYDADLNVHIDGELAGTLTVHDGVVTMSDRLQKLVKLAHDRLSGVRGDGITQLHGKLTKPVSDEAKAAKKAAGKKTAAKKKAS